MLLNNYGTYFKLRFANDEERVSGAGEVKRFLFVTLAILAGTAIIAATAIARGVGTTSEASLALLDGLGYVNYSWVEWHSDAEGGYGTIQIRAVLHGLEPVASGEIAIYDSASCDNVDSHWIPPAATSDPWTDSHYVCDQNGRTEWTFQSSEMTLTLKADGISGKPLAIFDSAGDEIACCMIPDPSSSHASLFTAELFSMQSEMRRVNRRKSVRDWAAISRILRRLRGAKPLK